MKWQTPMIAVVALVIGAGGALAYKRKSSQPPANSAAAGKTLPAIPNQTGVAQLDLTADDLVGLTQRDVRRTLPVTGQMRPVKWTALKSKVVGDVTEITVREGERVTAGQVIARIDPTEYKARLEERRAALAGAKATADNAERTRRNNRDLLDKNFISKTAYDSAETNADVARAQVQSAVAQLEVAQKALDDTVVRAPFAGMLAERNVQPGEKASVDTKLVTIMDLGAMEVEAGVPAAEIPAVAPGQVVQLQVEGFGDKTFTGKIARINPQAQAGSRTILVYIALPNPDWLFKGGMFAKGVLVLDRRDTVVTVPLSAVRDGSGGTSYVYALLEGKLRRVPVTLGVRDDVEAWVEIIDPRGAGLSAGAGGVRIVKANLGALPDGAAARVVAGPPAQPR